MLNSVRNHLGDHHRVGLRNSQLRQVSVSPNDNGVPKWLGLSSTSAGRLLPRIDRVSSVLSFYGHSRSVCKYQSSLMIPGKLGDAGVHGWANSGKDGKIYKT